MKPGRLIEFNGKCQSILDWCSEFKIPYQRTRMRIYRGWPIPLALSPETFSCRRSRISRSRFKMIEHLLAQRVARRKVMQLAAAHRLTVDQIAKGIHTRQLNRQRYENEQRETRCPHCGAKIKTPYCLECSMIRFKGM